MNKIKPVLTDTEINQAAQCLIAEMSTDGERIVLLNINKCIKALEQAVLAKLHKQEPVATIEVDSVDGVSIAYHQFQDLYDGMKLYAAPKEHHRSTKNHIPDAGQMVVPYGYRLVSLADIDTAIQRASVFDDGGDGADPESARSCIEILKSMLKGDGTFIDEGTNITKLSLSIDTKKAQALLQSYLDNLKGWQLVPTTPNEGMLKKAFPEIFDIDDISKNDLIERYQAMLAETPKYLGDSDD